MPVTVILESALAGLATVLGAALICFFGKPEPIPLSVMLGFAGGVMAAVTLFDLLPFAYACGSVLYIAAGFAGGIVLMRLAGRIAGRPPSEETRNEPDHPSHYLKMGRLIAIGIALHDLPEGISIAAGWSSQASLGLVTALAIGLHNIPEGVATAAPLLMGGKKRSQILLYCLWISLFTPLGAAFGLSLSQIGEAAMSVLLSLAAGAMTYLSLEELIPQAFRISRIWGFFGLVLGFAPTGWIIYVLTG
ncbi:MAG: ZIP family metal transporter [Peptococcaceae bacterium]|jgi:ZIP family zinc transporter|nr:ZIP family metal transporter [Peptococcaceae bacterium]